MTPQQHHPDALRITPGADLAVALAITAVEIHRIGIAEGTDQRTHLVRIGEFERGMLQQFFHLLFAE